MLAIALALTSSLAYGSSDFLGGLKSRSVAPLAVLLVSQGAVLVPLAVMVAALAGTPPPGGVPTLLLAATLAGVSETIGVAALYRGLATGLMSIVAPVAATAPVVAVASGAALGELPTPVQGVGIVLAVAGIVLTSCSRSARPVTDGVLRSIALGGLAALGFGCFYIAMGTASESSVPWALLVARLTTVVIVATVAFGTRALRTVRGADLLVLALLGMLILGADAMYALASTLGLLGIVAVLSSLHPLVTIGLARFYLHERLERLQQLGIALCLCGVVAISAV